MSIYKKWNDEEIYGQAIDDAIEVIKKQMSPGLVANELLSKIISELSKLKNDE